MPSADRLHELSVLANAGSIAQAAAQLGLPRATLSRRLKGLEEELGVRLLNRGPRHFGLTPAGERLVQHAHAVVAATAEAWRAVQAAGPPSGELRVSIPPTHVLNGPILDFMGQYPAIQVQLMATSRLQDLHTEGVDVALRFGPVGDDRLIGRRLLSGHARLYAAARYVAQTVPPSTPADLSTHPAVVRFDGAWRPRARWPLLDGGSVATRPRFTSNELITRLQVILEGFGVGLIPETLARPYVASGQLVHLLPEAIAEPTSAHLVYSSRRLQPPQVQLFIDFMVRAFQHAHHPDLRSLPDTTPPDRR